MFDPEFRQKCASLYGVAQRAWGRRFLGRPLQWRLAGGTEATGVGDYVTGDEFRYIDWNRAARLDELVTKRFQGNEDQHVYFLLDGSASMQFGTPSKWDVARQVAAALAYLALANQDSVGITVFLDRSLARLAPLRGKTRFPQLLAFLDNAETFAAPTNLTSAVDAFVRERPPSSTVVLVSDLLDPAGFERALDLLRRYQYQPFVVQLYDRFEANPEIRGRFKFEDLETGRLHRVTLDDEDLANYADVFREFCDSVRQYCRRYSIGLIQTPTDGGFESCIQRIINTANRPEAVV